MDPSENLLSKPVEPAAVEVKVKNQIKSEEAETYFTPELVPSIKVESIDTSLEDPGSPGERISLYASASDFMDTSVMQKEEDDLGICFEEEEITQLDFNSRMSFENEEEHQNGACALVKINQEASEVDKNGRIFQVPAASSSTEAENYHVIFTESEKSKAVLAVPLAPISEAPFVCAECGSRFKTRQILKKHSDKRHGKPSLCVFCFAPFSKNCYLKTHVATCREILLCCKECSAVFKDKEPLIKHLIGHLDRVSLSFPCVYCFAVFSERCKLETHLAAHLRGGPFCGKGQILPCNLCPAVFSRSAALKDHMAVHSSSLFSCEKCTATFQDKEHLSQHLTGHAVETSLVREKPVSRVKLHSATHSVVKPLSSAQCTAMLEVKERLTQHSKGLESKTLSTTNISETPVSRVKLCLATRSVKRPLSGVKSAATPKAKSEPKKRPVTVATKSNSCSAVFSGNGALKILYVARSKRLFSCMRCPATFGDKASFLEHLTSHDDGKRFRCTYCSAVFPRDEDLKTHLVTHFSLGPFSCPRCYATFTDKKQLTRHVADHWGPKILSRSTSLAAHSKKRKLETFSTVEPAEGPFSCNQSTAKFRNTGNLTLRSTALRDTLRLMWNEPFH